MSDGNTLIGNAMIGNGMENDGATTKGGAYLAGEEEAAISNEEDRIMSGEVTSEEDDNVEQEMFTVALVNSVVESTVTQSLSSTESGKGGDESKQRYSLRKRRRTGEPLEDPGSSPAAVKKEAPNLRPPQAQRRAPNEPPNNGNAKQPVQEVAHQPTSKEIPKVKTEAVPACTVAVAAAPLPVPMSGTSLPTPSSLPPALQPPLRPNLPPALPPKAAATAPNRSVSAKPAKDKAKRLAPPTRVLVSSQPLTPNPAATGVPNPLSVPLPASKAPVPAPAPAFKAKAALTVPCPLPPSTFDSNVQHQNHEQKAPPAIKSQAEPAPEKKKVTIAPDLPASRGRIFSIDLDPASLDFSVLDSGEGGTPAPASADLPLVTGGGRDRAFSFECFAFGINADEPLPPIAEHAAAGHHSSDGQYHLARPRGDSIIFDPMSFQEGGIHEEHALQTRESRGLSLDLTANADIISSGDTAPVQDIMPHPTGHAAAPRPPHVSSMNAAPPITSRLPPSNPPQRPPMSHSGRPDNAPSNGRVNGVAPHQHPPHHQHHAPVSHHHPGHYHHAPHKPVPMSVGPHPSAVPSNPMGHGMTSGAPGSAVSIIGSCASSTTLQMELLNKDGRIGIYLPEARRERIARFHAKRKMRIWRKRIKYDCRKKLADSRPRIKGRFVKRTDND